jgi:hypothetical protein
VAAVLCMPQYIGQVPWLWNVPRGDHNCHRCTQREKELIKQIREHSQPASQYHWFFVCEAQQRFRIKRGWVLEGGKGVSAPLSICVPQIVLRPPLLLPLIYIYTPPKWDNAAEVVNRRDVEGNHTADGGWGMVHHTSLHLRALSLPPSMKHNTLRYPHQKFAQCKFFCCCVRVSEEAYIEGYTEGGEGVDMLYSVQSIKNLNSRDIIIIISHNYHKLYMSKNISPDSISST